MPTLFERAYFMSTIRSRQSSDILHRPYGMPYGDLRKASALDTKRLWIVAQRSRKFELSHLRVCETAAGRHTLDWRFESISLPGGLGLKCEALSGDKGYRDGELDVSS